MHRIPFRTAAVACAMALALAACKPTEDTAADADAGADTGTAAAADGAAGADRLQIEGLPTEKAQASYMVGMDIAESLEQVEDEVDVDVVIGAIRDTMAGGTPKLTDEQRQLVRERFAAALQERRMAEMQAKAATNASEGEAFLAANKAKPDVQVTDSGLQYMVLEQGDGPTPEPTDVVRVHYKGTLLDGTVFDSSYERGEPAMFSLAQVVPGWQEGISLMPVGSKVRLWIPGNLGYGELGTPNGEIGPNATLVFDVELLEIVEVPQE